MTEYIAIVDYGYDEKLDFIPLATDTLADAWEVVEESFATNCSKGMVVPAKVLEEAIKNYKGGKK